MKRAMSSMVSCVVSVGLAGSAAADATMRTPQGVYVIVNAKLVSGAAGATLIKNILSQPSVSGLMLDLPWAPLNPNQPDASTSVDPLRCNSRPTYDPKTVAYDWTVLDNAFCAVDDYRASTKIPKNIQIGISPGFFTPLWVLNQINTNSCKGAFPTTYSAPPPVPTPPPALCGLQLFLNNEGVAASAARVVPRPLPWDPTYKAAWKTFLIAFAKRYGAERSLASIAIAGPTAATAEILMGGDLKVWEQFIEFQYPKNLGGAYWNKDQAFIDEWKAAIDMFGTVFSNTTLVITIAAGPPHFPLTPGLKVPADCAGEPDLGCLAVDSIVGYFLSPHVGGANAKSVFMAGLHALPETFMGMPAVKMWALDNKNVLGGAEFAGTLPKPIKAPSWTAEDLKTVTPYCPGVITHTPCMPVQAIYNTLAHFFDGTAAKAVNGGPLFPLPAFLASVPMNQIVFPGKVVHAASLPVPLSYVAIYHDAFDTSGAKTTITAGTTSQSYSVLDLLAMAASGLGQIAPRLSP